MLIQGFWLVNARLLMALGTAFYAIILINPLYTGEFFHIYVLNKTVCHFRGVGFILSLLIYF